MSGTEPLSDFKLFTARKVELILREDYAESLLAIDVGHPENLASRRDAAPMTGRGSLISVGLPDRPGERIVIRHYHHGGLLRKFTRDLFFRKERFIREMELIREAHLLGVPTLDVLGLTIRRTPIGLYRADLITREIPDTIDLMHYLSVTPRPGKVQTIRAVARAIRNLHNVGIVHADLNLRNILVNAQPGAEPKVFIIDLDKSTRLDELTLGERIWNLARLNRSAEKLNRHRTVVTSADRLRFFKEYAGEDIEISELYESQIFDLTIHRGWWRVLELIRGRQSQGILTANRILIKGANWLGDAVMSLPAIRALREACPNAQLAVVTQAGLKDLYTSMPELDFVIDYADEMELLKMTPTLRRWSFDAAILFPRSFRSALLAFLARIPLRAGYVSGGRALLLTKRFERDRAALSMHRVHYYFNIVRGLGVKGDRATPQLVPDTAARAVAEELLRPIANVDGPRVAIHPGATYGGAKQWFPDRFVEVAKLLVDKNKARIVLLGAGPREEELAGKIAQEIGDGALSVAGKTRLMDLAAVLERCDLILTNDTGPMHVAAAVGTPVVAIFGPTDPVTTAPFGDAHTVVREPVDCSPCLKRECPIDHRCMTRIDVNRVYAAAVEQLASRREAGPGAPSKEARA